MNRILPYLAAGVIGLGAAVALAQAQQPAPVTSNAGVTALIAEVANQQAKLAQSLDKIETELAIIEEDVRQARILSRRGGGGGGSAQ